QRAEEDDNAEAQQAAAGDAAQLRLGEAVFGTPGGQDAGADGEAHAGREDGEETGPQESVGVGCGAAGHGWLVRVVGDSGRLSGKTKQTPPPRQPPCRATPAARGHRRTTARNSSHVADTVAASSQSLRTS